MEFTLTREQLDETQKYNKLYNYIQQSFTKTYFAIGAEEMSFFFYGQKGALKSTFPLTKVLIDEKDFITRYFQIDFTKWTNALSKLTLSQEVNFRLTEKFLKVFISGSSDVINLGIVPCEKGSAEIDLIENFISNYEEKTKDNRKTMIFTENIISAITIASSMFSTAGNNNAVALFPNYVMYADRSLVLKAHLESRLDLSDKIVLHKYTAGVLPFLYISKPTVHFVDDYETLLWDDGQGTSMVLSSEPCEITLPTEEEALAILPQGEKGTVVVPHHELQTCLNFFNGFYEASVWKPITFRITANKEASLYYKHPTTEITKDLGVVGDMDGEFIIGSETLLKLVNKAVATVDEGFVTFTYDDEAVGVGCNIADLYEATFAKLTE